jgi:hypothetical protein
MSIRLATLACLSMLLLAACGGAKVVRHAPPPPQGPALAIASDGGLEAEVGFVIVRNGPGAWAKNADWDEYLVRVRPRAAGPVRIVAATLVDSLGTRLAPAGDRKHLVKASKQSVARYRHSGLKVKAGMGGAGFVATGLGAGLGAGGVAASGGGMLAGAAGATAFVMVAPAFGVAGIVRAINNSKVNGEIVRRHTRLPAAAAPAQWQALDLFFPLAPSPDRLELDYEDATGRHTLAIDLKPALAGLHLGNAAAPSR